MFKVKLLLAMLCVLAFVVSAIPQELTTGTLSGKIADEKGDPLPGVTVTATSERGVSKVTVTGGDGGFILPFLTPGTYSVKAEMQNFKTFEKTGVVVPLSSKIDIGKVTMQLGGKNEVITVTGNPVVDLSSQGAGGNITPEIMKSVPVGRTFAQTLFLAPGVAGSGVGGNNPSIGGASGLENSYIIDGVNITNAGFGSLGAYSIVFGSLGSGINFDFVKEVQVKSGGVEAEYGAVLGGVVNVITKSGGNTFDGDVFAYMQPGGAEGTRKMIHTSTGTVNTTRYQTWDVGFDAGGRLIKDKLFWFGAFDPSENDYTRQAPDNVDAYGNYVFPLRTILDEGKATAKRRVMNYAGKLTYNLNSKNIVEFSAFGDPTSGLLGLQRAAALVRLDVASGEEEMKLGGHNQVIRWTSILNPNWFLETQFAYHRDKFNETGYQDTEQIADRRTLPWVTIGGLGFVGLDKSKNMQFSVKSTNIFKMNELKYGFSYEKIGYDHTTDYTGTKNLCFNYLDPETGAEKTGCTVSGNSVRVVYNAAHDWNRWQLVRNRVGTETVSTKSGYFNWFAQDTFNVTPHFTIKAGVRWERQHIEGGGAGHTEFTLTNNWAPRIGASWDFMGDGKSKLYGFWGRYYEKIPNDAAVRSLSVEKMLNVYYWDKTKTVQPSNWYDAFTTDISNFYYAVEYGYLPTVWDSKMKAMYQDEFVAGVEREVSPGLNVSGRFIYRNLGRVIEDMQLNRVSDIYCGLPETDPNCTPADYGGFFVGNTGPDWPGMPKVVRKYQAFEIVANKRMSENWQVMASWRISRLKGNYEGLFNNDNGQSDPNITSKFDFPYANDTIFWGPTGDSGVLPTDRTHIIRVFGSYSFKFGLNLGVGLDAESGTPISKLGCVYDYGCYERLLAPRGSEGRLPWDYSIDFHADYTIKVAGKQSISLILDMFNLPNTQNYTAVDEGYESPDVGYINPEFLNKTAYQSPRQIRFGVRYTF